MAKIQGPEIDRHASYVAAACMGENLFRLVRIGPLLEPDTDSLRIRVPKALARRAGTRRLPGETLDACLCRMIESGLKAQK